MIKILLLSKKEFLKYADQIVDFYAPKYKHQFTETTVNNSAIICLAFDDNKIIGAVRTVSDLSRHALIVDLIVDENYRKQKIGTKLLEAIISELKKYKVKNIGLTTEPGVDWLADFYKKNGFKISQDSAYLKLNK